MPRDDRSQFRSTTGNTMYAGSGMGQYCWWHKAHKPPAGGRLLGKLRLWHCAECVARIDAAKQAAITAGNGTQQPKEN